MFTSFILPGVPPLVFWIFVGLGILIQGISKSGFAGSAGILSLPLMLLVMPVDKVAATMLPLMILCDMAAIYQHRHNVLWPKVMEVYLPSLIGIFLGGLVWWWLGQKGVERLGGPIKQVSGVIAIIFGLYIGAREIWIAWAQRHHFGKRAAIVTGITAGLTSTIAHAAGPIVSLYLFSQNLGKHLFVGVTAWTFAIMNLTKLPVYVAVGLIDPGILKFDLVLVPLIPIGSWLGQRMYNRMDEKLFNRVIMVLTLLAGVQLLFNVNLVQRVLVWFLA